VDCDVKCWHERNVFFFPASSTEEFEGIIRLFEKCFTLLVVRDSRGFTPAESYDMEDLPSIAGFSHLKRLIVSVVSALPIPNIDINEAGTILNCERDIIRTPPVGLHSTSSIARLHFALFAGSLFSTSSWLLTQIR